MKKGIFLFLLFIVTFSSSFRTEAQTGPNKYWIQFTDKVGSPFSLSQPQDFLSPRALERRMQQQIPVIENDLPVNPHYIDSILSYGVKLHSRSKWFNAITIETMEPAVLGAIQSLSFVANTQKVLRYQSTRAGEPEEPAPSSLKVELDTQNFYDYGLAFPQIEMLNGHILHNSGFRGAGIHIAVIDAGFLNTDTIPMFDSLRNQGRILGTWDFVDKEASVYEDFSHGMKVLSVMAANAPGEIIGTAPEAHYWLLRSEDAVTEYLVEEDNWIAAAEFADSVGADILNTSLGYNLFQDSSTDHSYADMDGNSTRITIASDIAAAKGMLVVNSAGNTGMSSWNYIVAPADGDSVLAVGAVDEWGEYAAFSGKGPSYDGRVKPNVCAMGASTVISANDGSIAIGSGTSFSSPIIAGMAACLWQANRSLSNMEILKAIEESAHQYDQPDDELGYGIPDFARANMLLQTQQFESGIAENSLIRVFPNPFNHSFRLKLFLNQNQDIRIDLVDPLGRIVASAPEAFERNSFIEYEFQSLDHLKPGVYFLQVRFVDKFESIPVIKL